MATDEEQERLLHALRASGSDAELADEERYRAMFRAERGDAAPLPVRSRAPRRMVTGGAAAAVLALGTGGVAAAYTGNLPEPVQRLAHHVIGAPAVPPPRPSVTTSGTRSTTTRSAGPSSTASPSGRPTSSHSPHPRRTPSASVSPSGSPTGGASPQPSPSAATTSAAPVVTLTGLMVVGTSHRADVGAQVSFAGQLTWSGAQPPTGQRVVLQRRAGTGWTTVAHGRATATGAVSLTAPPLAATSRFRLRAGTGADAVHSVVWRVGMHPLLTTNVVAGRRTATVGVVADGGSAGDVVTLVTRRDGKLMIVAQSRLGDDATATFTVHPGQRRTAYAVVLAPTAQHTSARVGLVVTLTGPST